MNYNILDNPVWHALNTVHQKFATGTDTIKKYPSDVLQILGCGDPESANLNDIEPWITPGEKLFMVGELAPLPANWKILNKLDTTQMICSEPANLSFADPAEVVHLTNTDRVEMIELINLVQPGFFHRNTPLLGNYFGIKQQNKLVAIAGERLKITGFTEISAVVTHPSFTGKGFAQQLVSHVMNKNLNEGAVPFLHFASTNSRARKVYELLGFQERKVVPFWQLAPTFLS